ncbi:MAG: multiheme c-type cytochrome [Nitrospirota bacterium]
MKKYVWPVLILFLYASPSSGGYRETFQKEFLSQPWAGEERIEESVCVECHSMEIMRPDFRKVVDEWKKSLHYYSSVSCHSCHGGDPKDPALSMSHIRGFVGKPLKKEVPALCGKCHVGIMKNYLESGHGKALLSGKGPDCVTCHGSHNIQKANIDIINDKLCSRCHSYERAMIMKQALFITEKKMADIGEDIRKLRTSGVFTGDEEKSIFSIQSEFRTLFHTIDVAIVKERTDGFANKLGLVEKKIKETFEELGFRRNFSVFLMILFGALSLVLILLSRSGRD